MLFAVGSTGDFAHDLVNAGLPESVHFPSSDDVGAIGAWPRCLHLLLRLLVELAMLAFALVKRFCLPIFVADENVLPVFRKVVVAPLNGENTVLGYLSMYVPMVRRKLHLLSLVFAFLRNLEVIVAQRVCDAL